MKLIATKCKKKFLVKTLLLLRIQKLLEKNEFVNTHTFLAADFAVQPVILLISSETRLILQEGLHTKSCILYLAYHVDRLYVGARIHTANIHIHVLLDM